MCYTCSHRKLQKGDSPSSPLNHQSFALFFSPPSLDDSTTGLAEHWIWCHTKTCRFILASPFLPAATLNTPNRATFVTFQSSEVFSDKHMIDTLPKSSSPDCFFFHLHTAAVSSTCNWKQIVAQHSPAFHSQNTLIFKGSSVQALLPQEKAVWRKLLAHFYPFGYSIYGLFSCT